MAQKRTAQLDARLQMTASLVRPHAVFADVGCDHGHLAIELMRQGAVRGYACDINPGPLESARRNILHAGLEGCVEMVLTDGLEGMEAWGITDVTIAGIGGEVITDILRRAVFLQQPGIRLILQPQSREHILRTFLAENGFPVFFEQAVRSGRYVYTVMAADYTGACRSLSALEAHGGLLLGCSPEDPSASAAAEKLWRTARLLQDAAAGLTHRGQHEQAEPLQKTAQELLAAASQIDPTSRQEEF